MRKFILATTMLIAAGFFFSATPQKANAQVGIYLPGVDLRVGKHRRRYYPYHYQGRGYRYRHNGHYYVNRRRVCHRRPGWYDSYGRYHRGKRVCNWRYY